MINSINLRACDYPICPSIEVKGNEIDFKVVLASFLLFAVIAVIFAKMVGK